ncbi:MAG: SseB family protein [Lachnospiraceae bacterium]|nr:SseB family protein [Lachnospiraceae bacterium]
MDDATKIEFLEASIEVFAKSEYTDTEAVKRILIVLSEVPVYFPVEIDFESLVGNINPMELKAGDTLQPQSAVKMKFCTLVSDDKGEVISMFTSKSRTNNPEGISIVRYYPQDYLSMLIQMDKHVIINPFSEYRFLLTKELMREVLWPFVQRNTEKFI